MTFIVAARYRSDLLFFADTAITSSRARVFPDTHTSFGQLQDRDGLTIEERGLKIVTLPPFVLAYAGDVEGATRFINHVEQHRLDQAPLDVLRLATADSLSTDTRHHFWILAGFVIDGCTDLWAVSTRVGRLVRVPEFISAGAAHAHLMPSMVASLSTALGQAEDALDAIERVTSRFQWEAARQDLLGEFKTGGAFIGAVLRSQGQFAWQRDVLFTMYGAPEIDAIDEASGPAGRSTDTEPYSTAIAGRGDGVLIWNGSHATRTKALFWHRPPQDDADLIDGVLTRLLRGHVDSYAFVSVDPQRPTIVLVRTRQRGDTCHAFHYTPYPEQDRWHCRPNDLMVGALRSQRTGVFRGTDVSGNRLELDGPYTYVLPPPPDEPLEASDWLAWHDIMKLK
jgi:hypothetical protein